MNIAQIKALRDFLAIKISNQMSMPCDVATMTDIRERMFVLAKDVEHSNAVISNHLVQIREKMFRETRANWNTVVFWMNPIAFGEAIEALDLLIAEYQNSEDDIWRFIHPAIRKSSKKLYDNGHYSNSAVDAFIEVVARLKKLYTSVNPNATEIPDGTDLMHRIFADKPPHLPICALDSRTGQDTQTGYRFMMAGAVSALRNPKSHSNDEQISEEEAMRRLMFASMLMYKIDDAVALLELKE